MDVKIDEFESHSDERGRLVVFQRRSDLPASLQTFGQIYFVTFDQPGIVRGNHYHRTWREWFGIVSGRLQVALCDVNTGKTRELTLDASKDLYTRLEIGANVAHAFRCLSDSASLLNYADREWDPNDSYPHHLLG